MMSFEAFLSFVNIRGYHVIDHRTYYVALITVRNEYIMVRW